MEEIKITNEINENNQLLATNQVVKSNAMIEGMYHLNTMEQKLILSLCSKISSTDNFFNNFEMSVSEFARFMGYDNKKYKVNTNLKKKCEELVGKTLTINKGTAKNPRWYIINWFHHIQYEVGKGIISMQFHDDLVPYLLNIQSQYTKYRLGYVMNFKSEYSFRIYELMKEYEKLGERTLPLDELKQLLFIDKEEKYQKYSHFKARVITQSLEEINKYSDLTVKIISEEKIGKKVVGIVFEIRAHNYKYPMDSFIELQELKTKTKSEVQKMLDGIILKNYKLHFEKTKTDLFEKEAIIQLYIEIKNREYEDKEIKYPILYFTEILRRKHAQMTGEEITKTMLSKYEMEKISEDLQE